jgi:hypothetical protein
LAFESSRPVTHRRPLMSSKRMCCLAVAAAVFAAVASPAAAQDPDPLPAPTLPTPDPAPPPARPRPTPVKPKPKPVVKAVPAPVRVAPSVSPATVTPTVVPRAKRPVRKKAVVVKPPEPLRRLPIRDASAPPPGETALVLTAAGFAPAAGDDGGVGTIAIAAVLWFALALALLVVAYVAPVLAVPQPLGVFLYERRSAIALIGVYMVAAAAVAYVVVAATS